MWSADINFTARPGETTAIIGSTGSGKSTLVNLIPRFYDVTEGQILIDGVDIREVSQHELRERIGYIPQKSVLFSGTIESNLLYADENASREILDEAITTAQAAEFVNSSAGGIGYRDRTGRRQCFRRTEAEAFDRPRAGKTCPNLYLR